MAPSIPDRWKDYKPVGKRIEGTRFVAFKVPLREQVSNNVANDIRLDGNILLKSVPELGLIIDLTNTKRYYDPTFFKNAGIDYFKLMIPGREVPPRKLVDKFNDVVKAFLRKNSNNDKVIGVHCTHGVNRTGFLICNYMISQLRFDPNEAINRFAKARGHKIERINYINALQRQLKTTDAKTVYKETPNISNWRDRRDKFSEPNHWRNRDELSKMPDRCRDRDRQQVAVRLSNWRPRAEDARAVPVNWRERDKSLSRHRSSNRRSRSKSPNYDHIRRGNDLSYQRQYRNRMNESSANSYRHVREPYDAANYHRPLIRTDYYSARPMREEQRNSNLQRYKHHRNTHNS